MTSRAYYTPAIFASNVTVNGGTLTMGSATSIVNYGTGSYAAPTFTTRSGGTKVVLYSGLSPTTADIAIGVQSSGMWFGGRNSTDSFTWYAGTTVVATLSGLGQLSLSSVSVGGVSAIKSGRNLLINGSFRVNQRGYVSGTSLAQGAYGHDGWRQGSSTASSYSFTQSSQAEQQTTHSVDTTVTTSSGNLQQFVEAANITGDPMTVSWTGTATVTILQNTGSPNSYTTLKTTQPSPCTFTPVAGATLVVQFQSGTLGTVQLEYGTTQNDFQRRPLAEEMNMCKRFCQVFSKIMLSGYSSASMTVYESFMLPTTMRAAPTATFGTVTYVNGSALTTNSLTATDVVLQYTSGATVGASSAYATLTLTAEIPS